MWSKNSITFYNGFSTHHYNYELWYLNCFETPLDSPFIYWFQKPPKTTTTNEIDRFGPSGHLSTSTYISPNCVVVLLLRTSTSALRIPNGQFPKVETKFALDTQRTMNGKNCIKICGTTQFAKCIWKCLDDPKDQICQLLLLLFFGRLLKSVNKGRIEVSIVIHSQKTI